MTTDMQNPSPATFLEVLAFREKYNHDQCLYTFIEGDNTPPHDITYGQLARRARQVAALLQQHSAEGDRVLLLYPPGPDYIAAFFACLYSGRVAVPTYPPRRNRNDPRLRAIVADCGAKLALSNDSVTASLDRRLDQEPELAAVNWLSTDALPSGLENQFTPFKPSPQTLVFLQYTSGSTGDPKGVMITHANLLYNCRLIRDILDYRGNEVFSGWLPPYHDMGLIGSIIEPAYLGVRAVLMPPAVFLQKPLLWLQSIERYRCTEITAPDFAFNLCVQRTTPEQRANLDLSTLRMALNGAEPVREKTLRNFSKAFRGSGFKTQAFCPAYGMAEATLLVSGVKPSETVNTYVSADGRTLVGCGRPGLNTDLRIVDPNTLRECGENTVGEIWVKNSSVAQAYWNKPELSKQTFHAYLADKTTGPFLRSGDLGLLYKGELYVSGRLKDLIIIRGINHYPQDIETTVAESHPLLQHNACAAFSLDIDAEERLVVVCGVERAYLSERRKNDAAVLANQVFAAIREAVSREHELQIHAVVLVKPGSISKTSSGKIRRSACREAFLDGTLETVDSDLPAHATQQNLAKGNRTSDKNRILQLPAEQRPALIRAGLQALIGGVMRRPSLQIESHSRLGSLGLDSIQAVELQHRLEQEWGIVWPSSKFLGDADIESLVQEISAQIENPTVNTVPKKTDIQNRQFPLSDNQKALWFLYQLAPQSAAYNVFVAARIHAKTDVPAMERAWRQLIQRHAVLRTAYHADTQEPVQYIHESVNFELERVDATLWDWNAVLKHMNLRAHAPFNLSHAPVLRVVLYQTAAQEYILLMVVHHIAVDLWSMQILMQEMLLLYEAESTATSAVLPPLEVTYIDYMRWQKNLLEGDEGRHLLDYWRGQLENAPLVSDLPLDYPRPPQQTFAGESYPFQLDGQLTGQLKELAQSANTTLFTVLLAAFQTLLHRYNGQTDIVVGTPVNARSRAAFDDVAGCFANTLPIRGKMADDPTFKAFLAQIKTTFLDALTHQDYPFQRMTEKLQITNDAACSPLFQVMFVFQQAHRLKDSSAFILKRLGKSLRLGKLELEPLKLPQRSAQFDLSLMLSGNENGIGGLFEYNTDLFGRDTIARLSAHWQNLLKGITQHPGQPLSRYLLLDESERRQILLEWNATTAAYPKRSLPETVLAQARQRPETIALCFGESRLTYRELEQHSARLSAYLQQKGIGRGSLVGICMSRSFDLLISILAILRSGAAYLPLDSTYPRKRLALVLEDAKPALVLIHSHMSDKLPANDIEWICIDRMAEEIAAVADKPAPCVIDPEDTAYVIYTSGSTGKPKGVVMPHRALGNLINWQLKQGRYFVPGIKTLQYASVSFDVSFQEIFSTWCSGGTLVMVNEDTRKDISGLLEDMLQHEVQRAFLPFVAAQYLAETALKRTDLPVHLKEIITAGEQLRITPELREFFTRLPDCVLVNQYGPSEAHVVSSHTLTGPPAEWPVLPVIGTPIANTRLYVLDRHMQAVPIGVSGELYIGGSCLAKGYLNRGDLTAKSFIHATLHEKLLTLGSSAQNPLLTDTSVMFRLYKTGDQAKYRADGNIEFLGRLDEQIKIRGFRIELGEIETVLSTHPGVDKAAVAVRKNRHGEKTLHAFLVAASATLPTINELHDFAKQYLPVYMVPQTYQFIAKLPLTVSGKLDRKQLPEVAGSGIPKQNFAAPQTEMEKYLAGVWREILEVDNISIHDDFFALGGHSLAATRMLSQIREQFNVELPVHDLFAYTNIKDLAVYLEKLVYPHSQTDNHEREEGEI